MGATESLLHGDGSNYDDDDGQGYRLPSPLPSSSSRLPPATATASRNAEHRPPLPSRSGGTAKFHHQPSGKLKPIRSRGQQPPPGPTRGGVREGSLAETATTTSSCQLRGWILGLAQSGKRTLLKRLQGKDPLAGSSHSRDIAPPPGAPAAAAPRNHKPIDSISRTAASGVGEEKEYEAVVAVVPYQPSHPVLDDAKIFLNVQTSEYLPDSSSPPPDHLHHRDQDSGCKGEKEEDGETEMEGSSGGGGNDDIDLVDAAADFAVLLVHPGHDRKRVENYVRRTVAQFLCLQGHSSSSSNRPSPRAAEEGGRTAQSGGPACCRPVCLCVLLNFRDLKPKQKTNKRSSSSASSTSSSSTRSSAPPSWLSPSVVQRWVMETLQDCDLKNLEPSQLVLQLSHASLYNCYGLDVLHYFVYQSYLCRQQWDARIRLERIRRLQQHSAQLLSSPYHPGSASYESFVKSLAASAAPANVRDRSGNISVGSQQKKTNATTHPTHPTGSRPVPDSESTSQHDLSDGLPPSARRRITPPAVPTPGRRKVSQPAHPLSALSVDDSRAALEAFLTGSDSEGEDHGLSPSKRTGGRAVAVRAAPPRRDMITVSDDDDDDDNFFVDHVSGEHQPVRASVLSPPETYKEAQSSHRAYDNRPGPEKDKTGLALDQETDSTSVTHKASRRAGIDGSVAEDECSGEEEDDTASASSSLERTVLAARLQAKVLDASSGARAVANASRMDEDSSEDSPISDEVLGNSPAHAESAPQRTSQISASDGEKMVVINTMMKADEKPDSPSQPETLVEIDKDDASAPNDQSPSETCPKNSDENPDELVTQGLPPVTNSSSSPTEESVAGESREYRDVKETGKDDETSDDEDESEFIIHHTFEVARDAPGRSRELSPVNRDLTNPSELPNKNGTASDAGSLGLSAAAREAIAQAQREAELMLPRRAHENNNSSARNKDRKSKKKKKEQKKTRRGEDVNS